MSEVVVGDLHHVFSVVRKNFPELSERQIAEVVPVYTANLSHYADVLEQENPQVAKNIEKLVLYFRNIFSSSQSQLEEARKVCDEFYEKSKQKVVCSKGCHWCCRLEPNISTTEAMVLLKYYSPGKNWKEYNTFADSYCPFLLGKRCGVYADRPLACRIHWVITDPIHCQKMEDDRIGVYFDMNLHAVVSGFFGADVLTHGEWGYGPMSEMLDYWSKHAAIDD
jgi:hypothetical protein